MSEAQPTAEARQQAADCRAALKAVQTREEIVAVVRRFGLERVADRLDYLIELEAEVPDEEPMDIRSLRSAMKFLLRDPRMPRPGIGVGPDGMVGFDWRLQPTGLIALSFDSADLVNYAAIVPVPSGGDEHRRFSGASQRADAFDKIVPFLSQVDTH